MDRVERFKKIQERCRELDKEIVRLNEKEKLYAKRIDELNEVLKENNIDLENPEESLKKLEKEVDLSLENLEKEIEEMEKKVEEVKGVVNE